MKKSKLLFLLAALTLVISGCNAGGKESNNGSSYKTDSSTTSSSLTSESESESESSSSEEQTEPISEITPPEGEAGFPTEAVSNFLSVRGLTDYIIPAVAENRVWGVQTYGFAPFLKIWTTNVGTIGTNAFEDRYKNLLEAKGQTVETKYYTHAGYCVMEGNIPKMSFKTFEDYFVIYVYDIKIVEAELVGGSFPIDQIREFLELMNFKNVPIIPTPQGEGNWHYTFSFAGANGWYIGLRVADSNAPQDYYPTGNAIEDAYKDVLIANGWEIDDTDYLAHGYWATKNGFGMQFFSWKDSFRLNIYQETDKLVL